MAIKLGTFKGSLRCALAAIEERRLPGRVDDGLDRRKGLNRRVSLRAGRSAEAARKEENGGEVCGRCRLPKTRWSWRELAMELDPRSADVT